MLKEIQVKLREDLIVPVIYLIVGLIWIWLSDTILFELSVVYDLSKEKILLINNWKGFFYVIITSVLLYFLIRNRTQSLIATKNDFKRFFEENPSPMWIYDRQTSDILLANHAACKEYGYTKEEFQSLNLYDLRPTEEQQKLAENLALEPEDYSDSKEWLHQTKSGKRFYANIYSHSTFYEEKQARIVTAININQRVQAEIEYQNVKRSLDSVALVSITDLKGYILDANDRFCQISKYPKEELIGQYHNIINSGHHSQEFWREMWTSVFSGNAWRADIKNKAKDGSFYWVDTVINPIYDLEGNIYKFMSVRYEITERKKLEERQQQLLDDLSDYAFQTSHELRGPLARMLGLISIFDDYEDKDFIIQKLKETSIEMDDVIREMNTTLDRNTQELIIGKRNTHKTNNDT